MKDYNDVVIVDNKSIVIRAKTRNKVCTKRRRLVQKRNTYLLKGLTLCADRHCTKPGTPISHLLFSTKGTVNFKCLESRSWRARSSCHRTQTNFPVSCWSSQHFADGPAKSAAQFWWVSSLLNSSPLGRGQIWFLVLPSHVSHSNFLCVNRYPHPLYIILYYSYFIILGFREWSPLVMLEFSHLVGQS